MWVGPPHGQSPGLTRKGNAESELSPRIHFCFSMADEVRLAISQSRHHAVPTKVSYTPAKHQSKPALLKVLLAGIFFRSNEEGNQGAGNRSSVLNMFNLRHIDTHYYSLDLECSPKAYMSKVWFFNLVLLGCNRTFERARRKKVGHWRHWAPWCVCV